jgi:hypothetical protein
MEVRTLGLKGVFGLVFISLLGGIASFVRTVTGISYVPAGHMALKMRAHNVQMERTNPYLFFYPGKYVPWRVKWVRKEERCQGPPKVRGPGLRLGIPFCDKWERVYVEQDTEKTDIFRVGLINQTEYDVGGVIIYRIRRYPLRRHPKSGAFDPYDIYNALVGIKDLKAALKNCAEMVMVEIFAAKNPRDLVEYIEALNQELTEALSEIALSWGVEVISLAVGHRSADPQTAMLTQIPAKVESLKQALGGQNSLYDVDPALIAALTGTMTVTAASGSPHRRLPKPPEGADHDMHDTHHGNGKGHADRVVRPPL